MTITLACSFHFIIFERKSLRYGQKLTREPAQTYMKWAVKTTTEPMMMAVLINVMTDDSKTEWKATKLLCSHSVVIGKCRPVCRTSWQRLTKTINIVFCFFYHHHGHLNLPAKTECQVLSPLEDQKTVILSVRTVQTCYFAMDCWNWMKMLSYHTYGLISRPWNQRENQPL